MYVYKDNIARIKEFYASDYYTKLASIKPEYVRKICKAIVKDPDACDEELLKEKVTQLNNQDIKTRKYTAVHNNTVLSLDCVTGWKALFDAHNGKINWIDDYTIIRQSLNAHMLWPKHGNNTINTVRYRVFRDRIDYTLYDIKRFYNGANNLKLQKAYNDPATYNWLKSFNTFETFIQAMHLGCFCIDNREIISLSDPNSCVAGYGDNKTDVKYFSNLIQLIS